MIGDRIKQLYEFSVSPEYSGYRDLLALQSSLATDTSFQVMPEDDAFYTQFYTSIVTVHDQELPRLHSLLDDASKNILALTQQYVSTSKDLENAKKLLVFYQTLLEKTSVHYLDSLSSMLTEVYQKVYEDSSSKVLLELEDYRGKKVIRLRIVRTIDDKDFTEELTDQGGSAQAILGIIVSIYCILTLNLPRVLFLDECLSSLSNEVLRNILGIFAKLRDDLGFSFLIIDHAVERFKGSIDSLYTVERGVYREILDIDAYILEIESRLEIRDKESA